MTYNHKTNHSYTPDLEFWRSMENIFESFPYWTERNKYSSRDFFINFYEMETKEAFDVNNNDTDIYGESIQSKWFGVQKITGNPELDKNLVPPYKCTFKVNYTRKIIRFLSNHISNQETVYKFQHFLECAYNYLVNILNFDVNNRIIQIHGLGDKNYAKYESRKNQFIENYIKNEKGIIKPEQFKEYFNSACIKHGVPFIMSIFNDKCYVLHTTDIFIEKSIQELPIFLSQPDLQHANELFVESFNQRNSGNNKECLAKIREGLEAIRSYIYNKYSLTKGANLHNDMERLFNSFSSTVFDYSKIPEEDPVKLKKIVDYLRDSVLLAVKFGNFGHHTISNPDLLEDNTSYFTLGLIASILPYLNYILK